MLRHSQWKNLLAACVIAASSLVLLEQATAETMRVSKDGSGGFSVIQDAVDAAAAGDTILIGAGRYTEFRDSPLGCCPGEFTYVDVSIENLTILGAHRDSVIIGPDVSTGQETIIGMRMGSSRGLVVQDLTMQQGSHGMRVMDSARIENVRFRDCWIGSFTFPDDGAVFENCLFEECGNDGIFGGSGSRNITVRGCEFVDNEGAINFTWSENPRVERCVFSGSGTTHVVASGVGVKLRLTNCVMEGASNYSVAVLGGAEIVMLDNYIDTTGGAALWCNGTSGFEARNNRFVGGWFATLRISGQRIPITITDNEFEKGTGFVVKMDGYPENLGEWKLSLQNNYWNTAEIDSVRAWVWDGHDDPEEHGYVKLAPILTLPPLPVEKTTSGGVKSWFRGK